MAQSTGVVLVAGAFAFGDALLTDQLTPPLGVKLLVGTVAAAFVSAGLDKALPGFGTGLGVLLLVGAVLGNGPAIAAKIFPAGPVGIAAGLGSAPEVGLAAGLGPA